MQDDTQNNENQPKEGRFQKFTKKFRSKSEQSTKKADSTQDEQKGNKAHNKHFDKGKEKFEGRKWVGKNPFSHRKDEENESVGGIREVKNPNEKSNLGLHKDLRKGVEANLKIQKDSLNAHTKINTNTKASVRITPLGGLGEIGGNITVIETQNSAIVIDVGMSFPDENMHGVDILIPDFSYLHG